MKKVMIIFGVVAMLMISNISVAADTCEEGDAKLQKSCKSLMYVKLPKEVKQLMGKEKCEVKTGSNYDYGYAVDLNDDGHPEILFCCGEPGHGPCYMNIYGKVKGRWKTLSTSLQGYSDDKTPCLGITILESKRDGYRDICEDGRLLEFRDGKYSWEK